MKGCGIFGDEAFKITLLSLLRVVLSKITITDVGLHILFFHGLSTSNFSHQNSPNWSIFN